MEQYLNYLYDVRHNGLEKPDRTGVGTLSVFGRQMRFDLSQGFPLVTTKKLHLRSIIHELLWFISGDTNVQYLKENNVKIWDNWCDANGDLGPIYGYQWRSWPAPNGETVDQLKNVIDSIKNNPHSRRHVVSAWNAGQIDAMALAPCHALFQFYVINNQLSCQLYQRSVDSFLGLPFNIASYALLTHMVAQQTNLDVGDFVWTGGDCHIYLNHLNQVDTQLQRTPKKLPQLVFNRKPDSLFDYHYDDFSIEGYEYHPAIKAPIAK